MFKTFLSIILALSSIHTFAQEKQKVEPDKNDFGISEPTEDEMRNQPESKTHSQILKQLNTLKLKMTDNRVRTEAGRIMKKTSKLRREVVIERAKKLGISTLNLVDFDEEGRPLYHTNQSE